MVRALFVAVLAIFFAGCEEEPNELGLNIQPGDNDLEVQTMDTLTLEAHSTRLDSIRSDETEFSLLGSYFDPVFGISTASFYTSFVLSNADHDFGSNPVADSIILSLPYKNHYGDTVTQQNLEIYELSEKIIGDSIYYSTNNFDHKNQELSSNYSFTPNPKDSVLVDTTAMAPHIRIKLDHSLAEKLITATDEQMGDIDEFKDFFKGLYVKANPVDNPGTGSISYLGLTSSLSKLTLYYHNDSIDSTAFNYTVNTGTARVNHFNHYGYQEASPDFKQQVLQGDSTLGNQKVFLQAMAGVNAELRIPHAESLNEKIAINDAMLYLPAEENELFDHPDKLNLFIRTADGNLTTLPDYNEGEAYFSGYYDNKNSRYRFRITRYLQSMIKGEQETKELFINIPQSMTKANRLILKGPEAAERNMRIRIIYTKVDDK